VVVVVGVVSVVVEGVLSVVVSPLAKPTPLTTAARVKPPNAKMSVAVTFAATPLRLLMRAPLCVAYAYP
jgi:hypothetical protein